MDGLSSNQVLILEIISFLLIIEFNQIINTDCEEGSNLKKRTFEEFERKMDDSSLDTSKNYYKTPEEHMSPKKHQIATVFKTANDKR